MLARSRCRSHGRLPRACAATPRRSRGRFRPLPGSDRRDDDPTTRTAPRRRSMPASRSPARSPTPLPPPSVDLSPAYEPEPLLGSLPASIQARVLGSYASDRGPHDTARRSIGMVAPASPVDWLQGLTMTTLLGGVAIAFSRALRLDESTFDEELILPRASDLVAVDA